MTNSLDRDLREFAVALLERAGGVADWPVDGQQGDAIVPAELAAAAQLPGEVFPLSTAPGTPGLSVHLAGEFLDVAARLLDVAVPREGAFEIGERYLTRGNVAEKVRAAFQWPNARVRCLDAEPRSVEYHLWVLHASLKSEDVWEAVFPCVVNSASRIAVDVPNLFQQPDLQVAPTDSLGADGGVQETPATYAVAVENVRRRLVAAASGFVSRVEQRLARDRDRLRDYYRALSREAGGRKRRTTPPNPEEVAAKKSAVDLEWRRKRAELDEQYAIDAKIRPLILARVSIPVLLIRLVVQRKRAIRNYAVYWNALTKTLEPLPCSRCQAATFSPTCTNEAVDLLCTPCAEMSESAKT